MIRGVRRYDIDAKMIISLSSGQRSLRLQSLSNMTKYIFLFFFLVLLTPRNEGEAGEGILFIVAMSVKTGSN